MIRLKEMMNNNSYLNRLNPITKIILMVIPTLLVSFAYDVYTPTAFFTFIFLFSSLLGKINLFVLIKKIYKFIMIGVSFGLFVIVTRLLSKDVINIDIILTSISLCMRIMVFSLLSVVFVITTDPNEFSLSLIHQAKLSYKVVYPFLIAYRFVPTFQDELNKIIIAKEIRGINSEGGIIKNILNFPGYILPLLTSAIRKGERVSIAMESRAFGAFSDRTYYKKTTVNKADYIAIAFMIIISILIIWVGINYGFIAFKKGLVVN